MKALLDQNTVSVSWLFKNRVAENLIVLNATIPKITNDQSFVLNIQIPNARFFDIKKKFSDSEAQFPNTCPSLEQFSTEAQHLGITNQSAIVIYDELGMYSSARAWWLFKTFGHDNVAVLDGGLPEWLAKSYPTEQKQTHTYKVAHFDAIYHAKYMVSFDTIETLSKNSNYIILDARSQNRFQGITPEPRQGLRSGTIPNSKNLPFTTLLNGHTLKPKAELKQIFDTLVTADQKLVMSCGSGITACILALGADKVGYKNITIYDGSWTEYGSLTKMPTV